MKKHLFIITILAFTCIFFIGCSKSDLRERYVGRYNLNVQGILQISDPNGAKRSVTWELLNQDLGIEKQPGLKNALVVKGYYECNATIDKSYIYFEPFTLIDTIEGMPMTLNLVPSKGFLNGDGVLTFDIAATGNAKIDMATCAIEGVCSNTARKQ